MFDCIKCFLHQAGFIFVLPLRVAKTYSVLFITAWMTAASFATDSSVAIVRIFLSPLKEAHLQIVSSSKKAWKI